MKIQYLGHSSFLLTSKKGTKIVTDPYGEVGFSMPCIEADAVTVSHRHYDHCNVGAVSAPLMLSEAGEYSVADISVSAVERFHDEAHGAKRGKNLIFRFLIDGLRVCHLGDLGEPCSPGTVQAIGPADVLLIPVGGNYTIDARTAKEYVGLVKPSVVIPMHYKTAGLTIDISSADGFLGLFTSEKDVQIVRGGNSVTLSRSDLGSSKTKILVLERKKA